MEAIVERKIQLGKFKEHPDCPDSQEATLFFALTDLVRVEEDAREDRVGVSWSADIDAGSEAKGMDIG